MKLLVQVLEAKNLTLNSSHQSATLNPFCQISLVDMNGKSISDTKQKTSVKKKTFNPQWDNFSFEFTPTCKFSGIMFKCESKDIVHSHTIGNTFIPVDQFSEIREGKWKNIEKEGTKSGEILISITVLETELDKASIKKALEKYFHLNTPSADIIDEIWCRRMRRNEFYQGKMIITNSHFCFRSDKKSKILDKIALVNVMNICFESKNAIEIFEENNIETHTIRSYKYDDFADIKVITLIITTWESATKRKVNNNIYTANDPASELSSSSASHSHSSSLKDKLKLKNQNNNNVNTNNNNNNIESNIKDDNKNEGDNNKNNNKNNNNNSISPSASPEENFAVKLELKKKKKKSIRNIFTRRKKFDNENVFSHSPDRSADPQSHPHRNHSSDHPSSFYTEETENDTLHDDLDTDNLIDTSSDFLSSKGEYQTCIGTCNLMVKFSSEPNSDKKNLFIRVVDCSLNSATSLAHIGDHLQLTFTVDNSFSSFTKIYPLDANYSLAIKEDLIFDLKKDPKKLRISLTNAATSEEVGVCVQPLNVQEKTIDSWQLKLYNRLSDLLEKEYYNNNNNNNNNNEEDEEEDEESISDQSLNNDCNVKAVDQSEEPSINLTYFYNPLLRNNKEEGGVLIITIHKCANLLLSPSIGEKNYFVRLSFGETIETTSVQSSSLDPKFNEKFQYELKGKKERAKSFEMSVWNCNADSKFSLIGQLTFNLDKLLQNKDTKSWYKLSVISDLSALSADRLDKLAAQARELDQFFAVEEEPKKVVPHKGRFRERSIEYGLVLPKVSNNTKVDLPKEKKITIQSEQPTNWKILLIIVLLISIFSYFLFLV